MCHSEEQRDEESERSGGEAIIASLENAAAALRGESGTKVVK